MIDTEREAFRNSPLGAAMWKDNNAALYEVAYAGWQARAALPAKPLSKAHENKLEEMIMQLEALNYELGWSDARNIKPLSGLLDKRENMRKACLSAIGHTFEEG